MGGKIIIVSNQIECLKCGDRPYSMYRHDYQQCSCQSVAVDGGTDYLRRIGNFKDYKELSITLSEADYELLENTVAEAIDTGRNVRGIVYAALRGVRDVGLLKGNELC